MQNYEISYHHHHHINWDNPFLLWKKKHSSCEWHSFKDIVASCNSKHRWSFFFTVPLKLLRSLTHLKEYVYFLNLYFLFHQLFFPVAFDVFVGRSRHFNLVPISILTEQSLFSSKRIKLIFSPLLNFCFLAVGMVVPVVVKDTYFLVILLCPTSVSWRCQYNYINNFQSFRLQLRF